MKKYKSAIILFAVFEAIAVWLWLSTGSLFYLLNFSYIGCTLGVGLALSAAGWKYAREFVQFGVGSYMLVFLGLICKENMQIEGFWYYLFSGVVGAGVLYYVVGILLALVLKDNRAFCKYICPITVFLKPMSYFSVLRVKCDESKCIQCGKCLEVCPMDVEVNKDARSRKNATECILCQKCKKACPVKALK